MSEETVVFFLGERFRWSQFGEDPSEENDEDSVINELELYLGNYEAKWDGEKLATPFEHWGWDRLRRVVWARRNSAKVREAVADAVAEKTVGRVVYLPIDAEEPSASWAVMAVMQS
ncbi:hypothetical protein [Methylomagnum sp.]